MTGIIRGGEGDQPHVVETLYHYTCNPRHYWLKTTCTQRTNHVKVTTVGSLSDFFFSFVILMTKVRQALQFNDKSPQKVTNSLINLNTHYSRYPPSLKALQMAVEFVCSILDEMKLRTYYLKDDNVKLWVEVIIAVTLLEAGATVDHLKAIITWSLWNSNCTFYKSKVFEKKHTTAILDIKSPHTP